MIGLHPLGAILFTAGYALREYGAFNHLYTPQNLVIYILSQIFIYICPPLLKLANYHGLGRVFYYVPYLAPLPAGRVLSTLGALMAIVECLNALGAAISSDPSSPHSKQELGIRLTIAALAFQLCVIIIFFLLAALFHGRCAKVDIHAKAVTTPLITLYFSMSLILTRCIYRLVEHLGNTTVQLDDLEALKTLSPILRYKRFFYIFEGTFMLMNSSTWNVWNPGSYLPRNFRIYLARDGRTEVEGQVGTAGQPWLALLTFGVFGREKQGHQPLLEDGWPSSRADDNNCHEAEVFKKGNSI